MPILIFNFIK
ncbi:hypothetical protein [Plasmodium yoelii yoelii]|uniref:Uncharacterized protein n=1 Tax=Plasmodium yoelii yoelii TaxID=73239 RepID=Q7RSJ0_PLAYO|nr:hypothetical protein [Plasmodium yoelii yoelii]